MCHTSLLHYARRVLRESTPPDPDFHSAVHRLLNPGHVTLDHFTRAALRTLPTAGPDAPAWRMLYIDAAILTVLARPSLSATESIAALDRAIIIAGAATDHSRRDYIVHDLIKQLQSALPSRTTCSTVFAPDSSPALPPPTTARDNIPTLPALPSIFSPHRHWSRTPFLVRGHADHWPALQRWASPSYLLSVSGPARIVPVEVGDDYRSDDWAQKLMDWDDFLSNLDPSTAHRPHQTVYLAQHNLLTQFPSLQQDIVIPDIVYACLDSPDFAGYKPPSDVIVNAWLGPKGTVSPAHTDPFFNCYVQVVGRKTVWLAPPGVAAAMYPCPDGHHNPATNNVNPTMSNTSRVDVFVTTPQTAFPLFWDVVPDKASCVTLNPGDLLFFPPGWWHAMRSEEVSFSVSLWF